MCVTFEQKTKIYTHLNTLKIGFNYLGDHLGNSLGVGVS